jgi:alanine transaminase
MSQRHHTDIANGTASYKKVLNIDSINPAVKEAKYAVRGELAIRANQLEAQLKKDGEDGPLPFKDVVHCEIGNPQALDQKPLTFIRQVGVLVWR